MATDATGTPTSRGIPKHNTAVDAPSGKGANAMMDAIDALLVLCRVRKNSAGSTFERKRINFIEGASITLTVADDAVNDEVDVTVATTLVAPTHMSTVIAGGPHAATANRAFLAPIEGVMIPFTFTRFQFVVRTTGNNMDLGIYFSDDESTYTRLFSTASFAVPATGPQTKTVATQTITPVAGRRWYVAVAFDNAIPVLSGGGESSPAYVFKDTSFPLPASLTAMSIANPQINWPGVGLAV